MEPDTLRIMTLGLTALACAALPSAIWQRGRPPRTWLLVAVVEIQFLGAMIAIADNFGEPLVWWRTPRIAVASCLALAYCLWVLHDEVRPSHGGKDRRKF